MKKILLLIPLLIALLACNIAVSTSQAFTATPNAQATFTFIPQPSDNVQLNATVTGKLSYPPNFCHLCALCYLA